MDSPGLRGWVANALEVLTPDIRAKVGSQSGDIIFDLPATAGNNLFGKLTTFASGTSGINVADLYAILGNASGFNATLRITAAKHPTVNTLIVVKEVRLVNSVISDLYDYDHDIPILGIPMSWIPVYGPMTKAGALIQAAHGTIGGLDGMVYTNIYQLDSSRVFVGRNIRSN
jgi:hypothetical protein